MPKLNAVDAISPAFNLTRKNLFTPFRWGFWIRIAILGFFTGELSSGGGCNFNVPANWSNRRHDSFAAAASAPHFDPHLFLALLPIIIAVAVVIGLVLLYVNSIFRFSLLEAILTGQISIRDSWSRWQRQGTRYFVFQLLLSLAMLVLVGTAALVVLAMVGLATFKQSGAAAASAVVTIMFAALIIFLLLLPFLLVQVLAKDFAAPVMALEGVGFGDAWRRVWNMVKGEFWSVAAYIGMKIVLRIAAGIAFGIAAVIVLIILAIPIGGLGVVAVLAGKAAGMTWSPATITLAVGVGILLVAFIIFVVAMICAPLAVFFPAYGLYFFAGRYQPLHDRLFPPPPPAPPASEPPPVPPAPEPPPEFLPT
ncbi:MAG TPA: hypothetical protein VF135_09900 [Terriglobales bacterium]